MSKEPVVPKFSALENHILRYFVSQLDAETNHKGVTSLTVKEAIGGKSYTVRKTLVKLSLEGFLFSKNERGIMSFSISNIGIEAFKRQNDSYEQFSSNQIVDSSEWTGIVTPTQVMQIMPLLSEIEDECERLEDNSTRSQILGILSAIKILLEIPNPPKNVVIEALRDNAFTNLVQFSTLIAATIAALRTN